MNIFRNKYHKRLLIIGVVTLVGILLAGCMGPQFTYQGVLTDASGNPLNGSVTITYRFFNTETGGTELYSETENVTVTDGRFDSVVGPGTIADASGLTPTDLAQPLWIEVQIDNGTYNETLEPRQRLYGAPYAFTLMPGAVISSTMDATLIGGAGIDAITTVRNDYVHAPPDDQALPALRLIGDVNLELVDRAGGSQGTIYTERANSDSDLYLRTSDRVYIHLDDDNTDTDEGIFVFDGENNVICQIDQVGNLTCDGTKSATVEIAGEERLLYAVESPGVWFEDFGSDALVGGQATVVIEAFFAQSVNLGAEYHVFLTPLGDCNGLFVAEKTATGFEVRELGGGTSNISFDYRIVAKRAGYEDLRLEVSPMNVKGEE